MSTPSLTPGTVPGTPPVTAKATISAVAEVEKSSHKFSPAKTDHADPMYSQGYIFRVVEVESNTTIKGFTNEDEAQEYAKKLNKQ